MEGPSSANFLATLSSSTNQSIDRITAAHRLNEMFAGCTFQQDAEQLAREACRPDVCEAMVQLITDGEELSEVIVFLMLNMSVHPGCSEHLCRAGALPVLVAAVRAGNELFWQHGLGLLSIFSEYRELVPQLLRAGVAGPYR